jgi:uncharacterized protein YpmB
MIIIISIINVVVVMIAAILLGHLKASPKRIKEAVMSCDTELLSIEHLQQMEKYAPSKKEVYNIHSYNKRF